MTPGADRPREKKPRWSTAKRAAAAKKPGGKSPRGIKPGGRLDRSLRYAERGENTVAPSRADRRAAEREQRPDRAPRAYDRDDKPRYNRDDRPTRSADRSDRPARGNDRDDKPRYNRDDRPPRSYDRGDKPRYDRDARPARGDDRPPRTYDRDARPARDDRPARGYDRDARPPRAYGRDDKPRYNRDDRPPRTYDRDDKPRFNRDDRPARSYDRDDKPRYNRDDRPARTYDRDTRPARDDRPRYNRDDRPARSFDRDDKPRYNRDDRPARSYDRDDRPRTSPARPPRVRPQVERPNRFADHVAEVTASAVPASAPAAPPPAGGRTFADLALPGPIVDALRQRGIHTPFPIQDATIPDALAGRDVLGRGQTGSGKTLAFGLPTLARLAGGRATPGRPRALVLVPTRELALQVNDALEPISRAIGVRQKVVAGGMPYPPQLMALERGLDLVVATPGRLQDLINRGAAILDAVEVVILDEADHMADLGFLPEVTEIMDLVPPGGQRLLFSATLDRGIDELAEKYLIDPITHSTDDPTASVATMEHRVLLIEPSMKKSITAQISGRPGKTLIFVRTQLGADRVAGQLRESGIMAGPIHGGLSQAIRNRVLEAFKDGRISVLVATDVAARGIHIDDVSLVVQVDPPADHKTYVHRSGRTARAGLTGSVVTIALPHQRRAMERIIDEVALSIRPEKLDNAAAAELGSKPEGAPVPEEQWQAIIAARPQRRGQRGGGRPRPDGGYRGDRGPRHDRSARGDRPERGGYRGDRPDRGGYRGSGGERGQSGGRSWEPRPKRG